VDDTLRKYIEPAPEEIMLLTANGPATVEEIVGVQVGPLRENIDALLLDSTPAVLSVGRRCMVDGYRFVWPPKETPYFIDPDGRRIDMEVDGFVPYIVERRPAAPILKTPACSTVSDGGERGGAGGRGGRGGRGVAAGERATEA
jgi:hypothetical protein